MSRSEILFANAQKHIPGGVNSPVRAFRSVGGTPLFFKHAEGAYVVDEDDKRYVDYVCLLYTSILCKVSTIHTRPNLI